MPSEVVTTQVLGVAGGVVSNLIYDMLRGRSARVSHPFSFPRPPSESTFATTLWLAWNRWLMSEWLWTIFVVAAVLVVLAEPWTASLFHRDGRAATRALLVVAVVLLGLADRLFTADARIDCPTATAGDRLELEGRVRIPSWRTYVVVHAIEVDE